jgi:hypothetical protein
MEWAIAIAKRSFVAACGGVDKYMRDFFDFPRLCQEVVTKLEACGGFRSVRDLNRDFAVNQRYGFELDKAIDQLRKEERIVRHDGGIGGGRPSWGWRLKGAEEE